MDTPIYDFVSRYQAASPLRLHMPGHKGEALLGPEGRDITEITGADVLYHPEGIIRKSEENAARLFGTARTVYSTEGSSLPIRAMLFLTKMYAAGKGEECRILAGRNAHKVFVTAAALLNIRVDWLYPEEKNLLCCPVSPEGLRERIHREKPTAVYLTSPDYLGNRVDIRTIAGICREYGVLLLVDNAHGAYLKFLPEDMHPMTEGADLCCDSAHKTLPVLTGGAYLHISKGAPKLFAEDADRAMALFASTSPSYLTLQSLDLCNRYLEEELSSKLSHAVTLWAKVKNRLEVAGYETVGEEPLKLTLRAKSYGYTGAALAELLEKQNLFCEFADPDYIVFMLSPAFGQEEAERLYQALIQIPKRLAKFPAPPELPAAKQVIAPTEAIFRLCESLPAEMAEGRIMASPTVSCPPAIPIVSCGERITKAAIAAMRYYGISTVSVIREED